MSPLKGHPGFQTHGFYLWVKTATRYRFTLLDQTFQSCQFSI